MWSKDVTRINATTKEAPSGAEGTVATEQQFCFVLLLLLTCQISTVMHSVVLPTIYEKYIHTKVEANLLKSVAYITPENTCAVV